jgi:hypothetical protein
LGVRDGLGVWVAAGCWGVTDAASAVSGAGAASTAPTTTAAAAASSPAAARRWSRWARARPRLPSSAAW